MSRAALRHTLSPAVAQLVVRKIKNSMRASEQVVRAICQGDASGLRTALSKGVLPDARYRGTPLLHWAIQYGQLKAVRTLAAAGASLNRTDDLGFTPLDAAVGQGSIAITRFLLSSGASVRSRSRNGSALHTACAYRRFEIVRLLLRHGADPNALDSDGKLPRDHYQRRKNQIDEMILRLLLEQPA